MKPTATELISALAEIPREFNLLIDHRDDLAGRLGAECNRTFGLTAELKASREENEKLRAEIETLEVTVKQQAESIAHYEIIANC